MEKKEIARLYGVTAKKLHDGQILKVKMTSIEGRDVAILYNVAILVN